MRIDAGHPAAPRLTVFVDGVPVSPCVEFDDDEGWARMLRTDDAGRIVRNAAGVGADMYELRGVITVAIDAQNA